MRETNDSWVHRDSLWIALGLVAIAGLSFAAGMGYTQVAAGNGSPFGANLLAAVPKPAPSTGGPAQTEYQTYEAVDACTLAELRSDGWTLSAVGPTVTMPGYDAGCAVWSDSAAGSAWAVFERPITTP